MICLKVFTNHLESLFSKNLQCKLCSNDLHWLFTTSWDINHFQAKLFLGIIHIWLTFTLVVVKIPDLLGKLVKCPFSCRKIHIMVYGRGLALLPVCPFVWDPFSWTYHLISTSDFCSLGGQPLNAIIFYWLSTK